MFKIRTFTIALAASVLVALPAPAQDVTVAAPPAGPELVDRVIAVVGDTVLLLSDVQAAIQQMEAAGQRMPTEPAQRQAVFFDVLEDRIDDLLILEAAKQAGVSPQEQVLAEEVEQQIQQVLGQFGGEMNFQAALAAEGMTRPQYRQMLIDQARSQQMREQFLRQAMGNRTLPLVSEEQIRQAFEARRGGLGQRPVRVTLQQVIVRTEPSDEARTEALQRAQEVLRELQGGGDFEVLARRFSEDPGSREQGGDLGWFRPGRMVPEFEQVVFAMRPGMTSGIVRTEFGYHIIRLDRVRGAERQARHILIRPSFNEADAQRARQRADSVATALRGGASPAALARTYGTPTNEMEVVRVPIDQLPPQYRTAVEAATSGQVVGPIEIPGAAAAPSFSVVRLSERQEAGEYTLEDVRDRLVEGMQQEQMIDQLVEELRRRIHVEVLL
jgi:peptidyl-prolyl cis-trans isomerase SurA